MTATQALSGLAIHTTTETLGLALSEHLEVRACHWPDGRQLADRLQVRLGGFLAPSLWSDLGWLAVCIGPGSFTGVRLGVITARTLAQALEIPLFGVSALVALAEAREASGLVAVHVDARRGERFAALFERTSGSLITIEPPRLIPIDDWSAWQASLPTGTLLIDGDTATAPPVTAVLVLAQRRFETGERPHWSQVEPFYGRPAPIHGGVLSGSGSGPS